MKTNKNKHKKTNKRKTYKKGGGGYLSNFINVFKKNKNDSNNPLTLTPLNNNTGKKPETFEEIYNKYQKIDKDAKDREEKEKEEKEKTLKTNSTVTLKPNSHVNNTNGTMSENDIHIVLDPNDPNDHELRVASLTNPDDAKTLSSAEEKARTPTNTPRSSSSIRGDDNSSLFGQTKTDETQQATLTNDQSNNSNSFKKTKKDIKKDKSILEIKDRILEIKDPTDKCTKIFKASKNITKKYYFPSQIPNLTKIKTIINMSGGVTRKRRVSKK
jgi:hypothetical protein